MTSILNSCQVIFVSNQFYEITQQGEINFIKVVFGLKERNRVNKNKREITWKEEIE